MNHVDDLQLSKGQPDAGELLKVQPVVAASVLGHDPLAFRVASRKTEVSGPVLDQLREFSTLDVAAVVGVVLFELLAESRFGDIDVADIVLQLVTGQVAVVIVTWNVRPGHSRGEVAPLR